MNPTHTIILLSHKWAIDTTHKSGSSLLSRSGRASKREQERARARARESKSESESKSKSERARARASERERASVWLSQWKTDRIMEKVLFPHARILARMYVKIIYIYIYTGFFQMHPPVSYSRSIPLSIRPSVPLSFLPSVSSWVEYAFVNNL